MALSPLPGRRVLESPCVIFFQILAFLSDSSTDVFGPFTLPFKLGSETDCGRGPDKWAYLGSTLTSLGPYVSPPLTLSLS